MRRFFHRPYLITLAATAICALMLLFLSVAYAQGVNSQPEPPSALKFWLEVAALIGLSTGGIAFSVGYIWNLWRKFRIEEEKETGETWKKLAESRKEDNIELLADKNRLEADKLRLEGTEKTLRERLRKQKKLTLRLIAKLEGEGTEFDESEEI